ncbi:adenosine deaminase/editase [Aspergillus multicolor]|uniref:tRNA-specific adenosine deaminase n=1 Tax=Aspergillus multicolor TaxID=41759 RepID=UPI003CCD888A
MGNSSQPTDSLPSRIATLVHSHFDGLPKRSKPVLRDDGTAEWIPMTGIVLVRGENTPEETLTCVAVTTGAKCLPASQIPHCNGLVLHDCHAEILAMRAFNYWLISECRSVLEAEKQQQQQQPPNPGAMEEATLPSPFIRRRQQFSKDSTLPPFEIHPDIHIYMYCTCAPCGDASMELVMAAQEDATPWELPTTSPSIPSSSTGPLSGRGHFSRLGVVRRKPARADAESTKSKSCSDKIALRQVSGLLSYASSLLVAVTENVYIRGLVMPEEEITETGCGRCFGGGVDGRMKGLNGRWWDVEGDGVFGGGDRGNGEGEGRYSYAFRPFEVLSIPNEQLKALWPFRKPRASDPDANLDRASEDPTSAPATKPKRTKSKPGTISAIWVRAPTSPPILSPPESTDNQNPQPPPTNPDNGTKTIPVLRGSKTGLFESIIRGVRQGHKAVSPGPGTRGASALCRARMWEHWRGAVAVTPRNTDTTPAGDQDQGSSEKQDDGARLHLRNTDVDSALRASTYKEFKELCPENLSGAILARKRAMDAAKDVLGGWVPNDGDEGWGWRWDEGTLVDERGGLVKMDPKGSKKRKR